MLGAMLLMLRSLWRRHIDNSAHGQALCRFALIGVFLIKLDGYRAIGFKSNGRVHLRSRNKKEFALRYPTIAKILHKLPDETVIDGEVVAFD
jgi:ATP-dependent DNA ligase